jgi:3-oxoacyl-[acyl-carrier-protein] synthase-3
MTALRLAKSFSQECDEMEVGIRDIAVYIPEHRVSNRDLMARFSVDEAFLAGKIGVLQRAVKAENEDTSDLALKALERLLVQQCLDRESIEALVVVTQNPDTNLPHVSALVHGRAKLAPHCAAFDLSLGCSGFVYGLSVMQAFLAANGLSLGVLITCDPYSKVIDTNDKNTALLFGDAATATLIGPTPRYLCNPFTFGTQGDLTGALECRQGRLAMNGRDVFNFAVVTVPRDLERLLSKVGLHKDEVDCYIFHQGSRYIVETLAKRIGLIRDKVRIDIAETGNTVSSSIPILLQRELSNPSSKTIILSGFGVGLSWASCLCKRTGGLNG